MTKPKVSLTAPAAPLPNALPRTTTLMLPNVARMHACLVWMQAESQDRTPDAYADSKRLFRALAGDWADNWARVSLVGIPREALETVEPRTVTVEEAKAWQAKLLDNFGGKRAEIQDSLCEVINRLGDFIRGDI